MLQGYTIESHMSKTARFLLFLLFVLAFLVSAPLLVLYTAGYRLDLAHGRIVHTAVLNITSTPRNAPVSIDNETFASERTPAVLDTILPGTHVITLEKTNYLPWQTTISFESREAVVMGPIILFLDSAPEQRAVLTTIATKIHEASNQFAYLTQESSWIEAWVMNASDGEKKLLMRLPYNAQSTYELDWSTLGTHLLLREHHGSQQDVAIARVSDGSTVDVPSTLQSATHVWWDIGADEDLYVQTARSLSRFDVVSQTAETLPFQAELVASYNGSHITLSQSNNRAVVSYQESETASIITYLPLGTYEFTQAPSGLVALHDTARNRLILIDLNNREQPILLNEEATLWDWHPGNDVLVYSSGFDLKRYVRSVHETQTLTRLSTSIDQLVWYPTGSALLYRSGGQILAANLDGPSILSLTPITTHFQGPFWIDPVGKQLHILEESEEGREWWTRPLQQ